MKDSRISFHCSALHYDHKSERAEEAQVSSRLGQKTNPVFWKKASSLTSASGYYTSPADLTDQVMQMLYICFSANSHVLAI